MFYIVFTDGTLSVFFPNVRGDILSHVDTSGIHDLFKQLLKKQLVCFNSKQNNFVEACNLQIHQL